METSPFGHRHPDGVRKENQLILGMALLGAGFCIPFLIGLLENIFSIDTPYALNMAIFTLCDLVILTACVMISMVLRNPILKWLIIFCGALNFVLPLITWMLYSLNL